MQKERYEISNGVMYLIDPELGLEISEPFALPLIPRVQEKQNTLEDLEVVWTRNAEGHFESAYLKKEGRFHGQYMQFYSCGKKKGESFYLDGKLHGPSSFHSQKGVLLSSSWFYEGVPVGKSKEFYSSGDLYSVQRYKKGKLHGKQEYFYQDSALKTSLMYHEGDLHGEIELFWPNGQVKRRAVFEKGLRHGEDFIWSDAGILLDYGNYEKGLPMGTQQKRYSSGVLKEETHYYAPEKFNLSKWDEQGQLLYEGVYLDEDTFQETTKKSSSEPPQVRKGKWNGSRVIFF